MACLDRADGVVVVVHNANPNVSRPNDAGAVYWRGSVQPVNAQEQDLWFDSDNGT